MQLGIILAILGAVSFGLGNTFQKKVASKHENYLGLFYQYLLIAGFSIIAGLVISKINGVSFFPELNLLNIGLIAIAGIIGYFGILFFWKGLKYMNAGVTIIIANMAVFLGYFANMYLFGQSENLPVAQIILAILFFIVVAQFLLSKPTKGQKIKLQKEAIYPVLTAIAWTVYFLVNTYFVKESILSPVQSVFFTEGATFIMAIIMYLVIYRFKIKPIFENKVKTLWPYLVSAFSVFAANFLLYYAYIDVPANIVNVIRLFSVIVTALLSRRILKDKMTKREIKLMILAMILLLLFVSSESLLKLIS